MQAQARFVRDLDMKTLMKESQLVFVGQVKSVKPSGMTTELTYPTWDEVVFEWLSVEMEVIEPVKRTRKGELVNTLMLSTRGPGPMINPPGMVEPKVGQYHLLCLLPANSTGTYASVTAPFDDNQAIFLLDRKRWTGGAHYYKEGKEVAFHKQNKKNVSCGISSMTRVISNGMGPSICARNMLWRLRFHLLKMLLSISSGRSRRQRLAGNRTFPTTGVMGPKRRKGKSQMDQLPNNNRETVWPNNQAS
jgi:hypothetical protein